MQLREKNNKKRKKQLESCGISHTYVGVLRMCGCHVGKDGKWLAKGVVEASPPIKLSAGLASDRYRVKYFANMDSTGIELHEMVYRNEIFILPTSG